MKLTSFKFMTNTTVLLSCVFTANIVQAQSQYVGTLNAGLGNGASVSCDACHSGSPSGGNPVLPMASTWRSGANLALSDSDGDGFTNAEEVDAWKTNFNSANITPYTLATGGRALANVYVQGDNAAVETNIASVPGLALTADSQTLGKAVNVTIDPTLTSPITLIFKMGGAAATSKVYAVDTYANTSIAFASSDWTLLKNGGVQINQWPAGAAAGTHDIIVVRKIPVAPAAGAPRGGEEEGVECVTSHMSPTLLMFFTLLALGFVLRRDKVSLQSN